MAKSAFLGMGVMGYPMAGHIAAAGHDVTVYNRTTAKAKVWAAHHGGRHAAVVEAKLRARRIAGANVMVDGIPDARHVR